MIKKFTGEKSDKLQNLYQDMLVILECVGIPTEDLTDRAKEKMVGACLAVGNVRNELSEICCLPKENALKTAKSYRRNLDMSDKEIYNQLVSEYGENFTAEEAQYAIDHLDD